jgi:hypothetical protein
MSHAEPNSAPTDSSKVRWTAVFRGRKNSDALYRRLARPKRTERLEALIRLITYRLAAAVAASLAIIQFAWLGAVAGYLTLPWRGSQSLNYQAMSAAGKNASTQISQCAAPLILWALLLVCVPRAHLWLFRLTMFSAAALGYYVPRPPPVRTAEILEPITGRAIEAARPATHHMIAALVLAPALAYILYRLAYILTSRTRGLRLREARPPRNHSEFAYPAGARRFIGVPVATLLLAVDLWAASAMHTLLTLPSHGSGPQSSRYLIWVWVTAIFVVSLLICIPRMGSNRQPFIYIVVAITLYALWPHALLPPAISTLLAIPNAFWLMSAIYLSSTGLGFDVLSICLNWPAYPELG